MNQNPEAPVTITSARAGKSVDIKKRQMRYLFSMGLRTVCFVGAIVTSGWLRWVLVFGAVFLPYVAVVIANATDRSTPGGPQSFALDDRPLLGPGSDGAGIDGSDRDP